MSTEASRDDIERRIGELGEWFHNLDLNGVWTAPRHFLGDYPRVKWERFSHALPSDLRGRTVLDVGCNAGFFAMEMKRRGADRVLAVDTDPRYLDQARLAAEVNDLEIDFRQMSVYELPALRETFDLVLFMGVLYHLRHPLLALDILHEHVTKDLLVMQSMLRGSAEVRAFEDDYDFEEMDHFDTAAYPKLFFVEERYAGDPTNWWIPNRACAEAMLRSAGFTILDHPEEEVYICRRTSTAAPAERGLPWSKP